MPKDFEEFGVLEHINKLSSAEEIFTYLLLPYESEVVNVSRLHIMKRFGAYLRDACFDGCPEDDVFLECRGLLKRAYADFMASTPVKEGVFKVFKVEQEKHANRFVAVEALTVAPR